MPYYTFDCEQCGRTVTKYRSPSQLPLPPRFCSHQCHLDNYANPPQKMACEHCGKKFVAYLGDNRKYCSQSCYWQSKENKVDCTCKHCGQPFKTVPGELRKGGGNYCSRKCFFADHTGKNNPSWKGGYFELTCKQCCETFRLKMGVYGPSQAESRQFCCHACKIAYWRAHPEATTNWKNGATAKHEMERKSWRYIEWRKFIFERDNYTCRKCKKQGKRLHAHHLYEFSKYPHLRYSIDNGHTLCRDCHKALKGKELEYRVSIGLPAHDPPFRLPLLFE